jgi:hypothetical protein
MGKRHAAAAGGVPEFKEGQGMERATGNLETVSNLGKGLEAAGRKAV